jgi:hypothetical protein
MSNLAVIDSPRHVERLDLRSKIIALESKIAELPDAFVGDSDICPLKHSFGGGIYMREIFIPADTLLTGKIHRHDHPNVLLEGEVSVVTESGGVELLKAPLAMISPSRTKRALYTHTDCRWITFHNVGDERDLQKIESMIIAKSYAELEGGETCLS